MPQEALEIARQSFEAWNRGDVDAWLKHCAPGFEFDMSRAVGPVHGTYGRDQFRQAFEDFFEPWESVQIELDELIDAGENVMASVTGHFRGRDGMEVRARVAYVLTIRDEAIEHICFYQERQDAFEDAGLAE